MKKETKYWIRYYSPGSFFSETSSKDCEPGTKPEDVEWPENAYAFVLMKREDALDGDKRYTGDAEQIGLMCYHHDSIVETLPQLIKNPNSTRILISNAKSNNWDQMVWNRWGHSPQPFDEDKDVVMEGQTE